MKSRTKFFADFQKAMKVRDGIDRLERGHKVVASYKKTYGADLWTRERDEQLAELFAATRTAWFRRQFVSRGFALNGGRR